MKAFAVLFCLVSSVSANADSYERVYCDYYSRGSTSGYSLFRARDGVDLGNAVWSNGAEECNQAAALANWMDEGIACARYYNRNQGTTAYSVYRIYDGQDLGNVTIADFHSCQAAVRSARRGIFCTTYMHQGSAWWSMYDVHSGNDLGTQVYPTLDECQRRY